MRLSQIVGKLPGAVVEGEVDAEIAGVGYDPLRVAPGDLYVAINIYTQLDKVEIPDGHAGVARAIAAGARAVIVERDMALPAGVTKVVVPDSRAALAVAAGEVYDHPWRHLKVIGITGTNGKTTSAHVVESILAERHRVGLMGTLYYKVAGAVHPSKDTTPEPPDLQAIFQRMVDAACAYAVMEVSSHGVDLHRVDGLAFELGAWTNLSQDHLDYHGTMEAYGACKRAFIRRIAPDKAVVLNADDPSFGHFAAAARARVISFGIDAPADIMARDIRYAAGGTTFTLATPAGAVEVTSRLRARFNVANALVGAACAYALGLDLETIKAGLDRPIVVAGRFQPVERGQDFGVVVDYAHTPEGLATVLAAARATRPARIITVFGCGGDRDPGKRPRMGHIAAAHSDLVILADDNPRGERPEAIVEHILAGIGDRDRVKVVHDRHAAIAEAIGLARPGDLVLIAGKGHETQQIFADRSIPFDDFAVADAQVAARLGAGPAQASAPLGKAPA